MYFKTFFYLLCRSRHWLPDASPIFWAGHVERGQGLGRGHQHSQQHGQGGSHTPTHITRKHRLNNNNESVCFLPPKWNKDKDRKVFWW